jgi:hypothetical protein
MEDIPPNIRVHLFIQQDGTPAHNSLIVREYLERTFNHRWMGTCGPVQ